MARDLTTAGIVRVHQATDHYRRRPAATDLEREHCAIVFVVAQHNNV